MKSTLIILLVLILGGLIRFDDLGDRTISHPEFYVPGLDVPDYVFHPNRRMTASEVFAAPYKIHHPHLPGYDLLMLGWVKVWGTEMSSIRASSALFGTLALLVMFLLARETINSKVAVLSTSILAFHGHQIYWSQMAKQWVLLGLVGILTTFLISRLSKKWNPKSAIFYTLCSAFGLWIDSYFWPIFAAQILWVLYNDSRRDHPSLILGLQVIALLFASPAVSYLIRISSGASHLPPELWPRILEMLQLGGMVIAGSTVKLIPAISIVAGIIGLVLLVQGVINKNTIQVSAYVDNSIIEKRLWKIILLCIPIVLVINVVIFRNENIIVHRRSLFYSTVFALVVPAIWWLLRKKWNQFGSFARKCMSVRQVSLVLSDLPSVMMLVPFLLLLPIHLMKPVYTPYALVTLAPFFILVASRGVMSFSGFKRNILIAGIAALSIFSLVQSENIPDPTDYKLLANKLLPEISEGEILLVDDKWYIVPVIYYFPPSKYMLYPSSVFIDGAANIFTDMAGRKHSRFWLIDFVYDDKQKEDLRSRVILLQKKYRKGKELRAKEGVAILFENDRKINNN